MKSERWQQIERLYYDALEREASQRADFLDQACAGDEALRREVESLLDSHGQAGDFLSTSALEEAAKNLAANPVQSPVGRRISHYQILSLLGAGGMGEVYLAEDTRLGRKIALKLLPTEFTQDREERYQSVKDLLLDLKNLKLELEVEAKLKRTAPPEVKPETKPADQPIVTEPPPALPSSPSSRSTALQAMLEPVGGAVRKEKRAVLKGSEFVPSSRSMWHT